MPVAARGLGGWRSCSKKRSARPLRRAPKIATIRAVEESLLFDASACNYLAGRQFGRTRRFNLVEK